jgi:indolepyruvate ferredoxin oxidoreductase beta subunit
MATEARDFHILNVGVGGQGVIRASQILAWAALREGMNVRAAETHGMAQRGGSVVCYLNVGPSVEGPLFAKGTADIILSFEEVEALRNVEFANEDTFFLIATTKMIPVGVLMNKKLSYPTTDEIVASLKKVSKNIFLFNAEEIALESGDSRTANTVMLAFLLATNKIKIKKENLKETIKEFVPEKAIDANMKAFDMAYEKAQKIFGGN